MGVDNRTVIQNMLPKKLKDPMSFLIPCQIGTMNFERELCDLGVNVSQIPCQCGKKVRYG